MNPSCCSSWFGLRWVGSSLAAFALYGCFLGYDSRWGEQKRAQQNYVRATSPQRLRPVEAGGAERGAPRVLELRVRATRTYASQVLDWQRRFDETLAEVNRVLAPALSARLVVSDASVWNPNVPEDDLEQVLGALRDQDAGDRADWVIVLVGSVPRFAQSFHDLGMADIVGEHIALRAINNAAEYEAIENGLTEISAAERDRLRRARLSHKVTAVMLHEIGHTLGALHERNPESLLNPSYRLEQRAFSAEAVNVMKFTLAHRDKHGKLDRLGGESLAELWRREPAPWISGERDQALASLSSTSPAEPASPKRAIVKNPGETAPSTAVRAEPQPLAANALAALSETDRRVFEAARRRHANGDVGGARELAAPLFETYVDVEAVQDFRCRLAMQQNSSWSLAQAECAGLMKLTPAHRRIPSSR